MILSKDMLKWENSSNFFYIIKIFKFDINDKIRFT
jgi:hypothetical protein